MSTKTKGQTHAVVPADVAAGSVDFFFDHIDGPISAIVQVRTAAGVLKAHDGAVTILDKKVTVDNAGAVDFADTDVITVVACN